jgi:hypothetical protein
MLWPSRKKMTAKKTINRNCLIPNEGGFRPAGSVVFNELAIDLILTTSVNFGAVRQGANCCNIPVTLIDPDDRGFECDGLLSTVIAASEMFFRMTRSSSCALVVAKKLSRWRIAEQK